MYGKACNTKYRGVMEKIGAFLDDASKRLQRPVQDLEDIRFVMMALKDVRAQEVHVDRTLPEIEVSQSVIK